MKNPKRLYKYRVKCEDGWYLELLPNNNNRQYVGRSQPYETREEALAAREKLIAFLTDKQTVPHHEEKAPNTDRYSGAFSFSDSGDMFRTRFYPHKSEIKEGIRRIIDNYNAPFRADL